MPARGSPNTSSTASARSPPAIAVPIFAFFAAGVEIGGLDGLTDSLTDPIALGIVAGLVVGKPIGILGTAWLTARFTHASLDDELTWLDVLGVALLGGIGFTVSLLIGDLAFGAGAPPTTTSRSGSSPAHSSPVCSPRSW